jgi:hypothetical protein
MGLIGWLPIDAHHALFHLPRAFRPRLAKARAPKPGIQPLIIPPFSFCRHRKQLSPS